MDTVDNVCEPRRVTVQSIRERFEQHRLMTPVTQPETVVSEVDSSGSSSNASESDSHSSTGGFHQHNRTSIKRSPAFRTGHKTTEVIHSENGLKKPALNRTRGAPNQKKPSLRRKPGVDRTSKPNLSPEPTNVDPLIEEALKAPLPAGPAPKKPPRTFVHDAFIRQQQGRDEPDSSPQRPARRTKSPPKPPRPTSIAFGPPFTMSRSKTEPFLLGRKRSTASDECPAVEDLRQSPLDDGGYFKESRWLNPVQWNSFSPCVTDKSPMKKQQRAEKISASMLAISDPDLLERTHLAGRLPAQEPVRRMSCDFDGGPAKFTWQPSSSSSSSLGFHGRKDSPVSLGHVYEQPTLEGGLHYMVRGIPDLFFPFFSLYDCKHETREDSRERRPLARESIVPLQLSGPIDPTAAT